MTDDSVVCWGSNRDYGGKVVGQATPPEGEFAGVNAGWFHTCGVMTDGFVACWGKDEYGQVTPLEGEFASVSAAESHACGVKTDGAVACWGILARGLTAADFE